MSSSWRSLARHAGFAPPATRGRCCSSGSFSPATCSPRCRIANGSWPCPRCSGPTSSFTGTAQGPLRIAHQCLSEYFRSAVGLPEAVPAAVMVTRKPNSYPFTSGVQTGFQGQDQQRRGIRKPARPRLWAKPHGRCRHCPGYHLSRQRRCELPQRRPWSVSLQTRGSCGQNSLKASRSPAAITSVC